MIIDCLNVLASGDLRNVVKSIMGFPITYAGLCEVFINDNDPDVVARNIILLLCACSFDPGVAAEMMLHIWYPAEIPQQMILALREKILSPISEVCEKIQGKPSRAKLQSKTWTFGSCKIRVILTREHWEALQSYFKLPDGFSIAQARACRLSTILNSTRIDYLEQHLFEQIPAIRVSRMRFLENGILLPFGASKTTFDTPNP